MTRKIWMSAAPEKCDVCGSNITNVFYDAQVGRGGPWGCICEDCFHEYGCSLGTGRGQKYTHASALTPPDSTDDWVKTGG